MVMRNAMNSRKEKKSIFNQLNNEWVEDMVHQDA
jgi:hypothetical protein